MPDNVGYTPGTGATVAADDIGGVLHQRVKIGIGADGVATDVSAANPMPVSGVVDTGLSQPLTDTQLRATPVPVSGSVTANTGLSQPLTDSQLRATPVPVSGTVTANTGLTQPLTDAQLRATAVPVSGPLTDAQLRATPVPISGTITANTGLTDVATGAKQDTGNASLASINANILTNQQLRALPVDINATGELIDAIESLRMTMETLKSTLGWLMPDTVGRLRTLVEQPTAANLNVTASIAATQTLATVTTVSTLTNQTQVGSFNANDQIPALMNSLVSQLRRNIITT